ncbi:MAG: hypothetical protein B7Z35_03375 [Hydrogenophilales bacterium 12-61-10]|nr:MAG: hypothetical protein B7Z35_03375 [Hydrogenophilales bacterium 12-61-10]
MFKKQWPAFVLAFVLPLVAVFWWWGGFSPVSVSEIEAGPYRYAYVDYEGPISNMRKPQRSVLEKFNLAKVEAGTHGKVRAHVGYTLGESAPIPAGLKEGRIAARPVYAAQVHAVVLLAPSKAYQKLADALESQGKTLAMPTVELYRPAGQSNRVGHFTLEMDR